MISRYGIFCKVVECGNFTRAGEDLGYSQSAISQTVKGLERELGVTLLERRKDGIVLSRDGEGFYPFILRIWTAEQALEQKQREMQGLENSLVRIGAVASVTRSLLLPLMHRFKENYPNVSFDLLQGEYTNVEDWVSDGSVDFGFTDLNMVSGYGNIPLYEEEMVAVFPAGHPAARKKVVTLQDVADEPFILLDEGKRSEALHAFRQHGVTPNMAYKVSDNFTVLEMVRQGFGTTMVYRPILEDARQEGLVVRPVSTPPVRRVALIWKNWDTMPLASRRFVEFVQKSQKDPAGCQKPDPVL